MADERLLRYTQAMEIDPATNLPMQKVGAQIEGIDGVKLKVNADGTLSVAIAGASSTGGAMPIIGTASKLSDVVTLQNAAVVVGAGTVLPTSGHGVASLAVSGTFVGTISFEGQGPDNAWYPISTLQRGTGAISTTANVSGLYEVNTRGLTAVRANITSYTSGSITVKGQAQPLGASDHFIKADTTLSASTVIQPIDQQARLTVTQAAQAGVLVAPSTTNQQSSWTPVPDGMSEFINNLTIDVGVTPTTISVSWSEDGSAASGRTDSTVPTSLAKQQKTSSSWYPVGGAFYKVEIWNGDTAAHTCTANIKFRP